MNAQRTIPILIDESFDITATAIEFARYQQAVSLIYFNNSKPMNALALHKIAYKTIKTTLSSQFRCSAIRLVASAYVSAKSNKRPAKKVFQFKKGRVLFLIGKRGRDASFKKDGTLSVSTVNGRIRIKYKIPDAFVSDFENAVSVDCLSISESGTASLCITLEFPDPKGIVPVGVDLGVNNAVVASTATDTLFISGKNIAIRNKKTRKTRSRLQGKLAGKKAQREDTRSVRRALKRLSRKHRNRNDSFCKESAVKLVRWAPKDAVLVFEDLKVKPKTKKDKMRRGTRRKMNQWFYRRMIQATKNRSERDGIAMAFVNPAFTSQICHACGLFGVRFGSRFSCPHCRHSDHADRNASLNIRSRFAALRGGGPPSAGPETLRSLQG